MKFREETGRTGNRKKWTERKDRPTHKERGKGQRILALNKSKVTGKNPKAVASIPSAAD